MTTFEQRSIYSGPVRRALDTLTRKVTDLEANGGGGPGPGTGVDEVWIGPTAPSDPAIELWFDTDAPPPPSTVSAIQIIAVPYADWPPVGPLPNVLYLRIAP